MKLLLTLFSILICVTAFAQKFEKISGLKEEVEIMIDPFGVPHIYAKNENDMFFAQGFQAASDRLFQFEMWRRQARGLLSELLGERELQKDIASRLFTYRGDLVAEFNHYHPNGYKILHSFVNGVNAAIDNALLTPDSLPVEFRLLGINPQHLKPEDIISRHQGLLGNLTDEWETALVVHQIGEDKTKEINWYHPNNPDLRLDSLVKEILSYSDVMDLYKAFKRPVNFLPEDILAFSDRNSTENYMVLSSRMNEEQISLNEEKQVIGSNNWVVSGALSESGFPMLANDPHRAMSAPSLRYITHLVSPGWNVIGGGEPTIPGVSI